MGFFIRTIFAALCMCLVFGSASAMASFSGSNGPIVGTLFDGSTVEVNQSSGEYTVLDSADSSRFFQHRRYSPDGSRMVINAASTLTGTVYVASASSPGNRTAVASGKTISNGAAWSPDGRWVAYIQDGDVKAVPAAGGSAVVIFHNKDAYASSIDWSSKNKLAMQLKLKDGSKKVAVVNATGSGLRYLTGNSDIRRVSFSPDGSRIAYVVMDGASKSRGIYSVSVTGGTPRTLVSAGDARELIGWQPNGSAVLYREGTKVFSVSAAGGSPTLLTTVNYAIRSLDDVRPLGGSNGATIPKPGSGNGSGGNGNGNGTGNGNGGTGNGNGGNGNGGNGGGSTKTCGQKQIGPFNIDACFKKSGSTWKVTAKAGNYIKMNGLTIKASGGLQFDTASSTLSADGTVKIAFTSLGSGWVYTGYMRGWKWNKTFALNLNRSIDIKGLKASGSATLTPSSKYGGSIIVGLNANVPTLKVQGAIDAILTKDRFDLTSSSIEVKDVAVPAKGPSVFILKSLVLSYEDRGGVNVWKGDAKLALPQMLPRVSSLSGGATISAGALTELHGGAEFSKPGIQFGTSPIFLQEINVEVSITPIGFGGSVRITAGPEITVKDHKLSALSGTIGFKWSSKDKCSGAPSGMTAGNVFTLSGELELVEIVDYSGKICAMLSGYVELQGKVSAEFGAGSIEGELKGWMTRSAFNISGKATATVTIDPPVFDPFPLSKKGTAIMSSKGASACAGKFKKWTIGIRYKWKTKKMKVTCNTKGIKVEKPDSKSASKISGRAGEVNHWDGAPSTVIVPSRAPQVTFEVESSVQGVLPRVTITAPDGTSIVTPSSFGASDEQVTLSTSMGDALFLTSDDGSTLYVMVAEPGAGTWTVQGQTGSPALIGLEVDQLIPDPVVSGSVTKDKRGRMQIRWTAKNLNGASVEISETGYDVGSVLFSTRSPKGAKPYKPAAGLGQKRQIKAVVTRDGVPVYERVIATVKVPAPRKLRAPRATVKRNARGKLVVRWNKVPGASSYIVAVSTGKGHTMAFIRTNQMIVVPNPVAAGNTVRVYAQDRFGRSGAVRGLKAPQR